MFRNVDHADCQVWKIALGIFWQFHLIWRWYDLILCGYTAYTQHTTVLNYLALMQIFGWIFTNARKICHHTRFPGIYLNGGKCFCPSANRVFFLSRQYKCQSVRKGSSGNDENEVGQTIYNTSSFFLCFYYDCDDCFPLRRACTVETSAPWQCLD